MAGKEKRRLAAIMFTDIVGYSQFMMNDEKQGRLLRKRHKEIFEKCTSEHQGRVIQYYGDGTLSIFESAVSAVECAVSMQKEFQKDPQVPLRIGIHLGDIHYDETEVFGHGVNVAARIEPVCNPGGIFISDKVYDEIKNQSTLKAQPIGIFQFKNIEREMGLYAIVERGVLYPDSKEINLIKELTGKMSMASAADKSDAMKRYLASQKRARRKKYIPWFATILFLMFSLFAFSQWGKNLFIVDDPNDSNIVSIAVLPFTNMSDSEENEYFSDGITEDILTIISKLEGFSVTSRTSVMQYKQTEKTTRRIARELDVDHILEGSVRRDGNMVRITAQLIDAREDEHIWAKSYDEELTSIFGVQSEVATDIARHLKKNLSISDRDMIKNIPTENVTAYENYLKGRKYYRKYTKEDNETAISYFNDALEADNEYAYAFAGLGDAYAQKAFHSGKDEITLDSAVYFSQQAIKFNPELSEGHKALGLAYHYKGQSKEALKSYHRAIELDPYNDMASNNIGQIEIKNGNFVEGVKWAKHTMKVNKNVPASAVNLAKIYMDIGDNEIAETILNEGISVNPEVPVLRELKGEVLLREGKYDEAKLEARKLIEINPESSIGYALMGDAFVYEKEWDLAGEQFATAHKLCSEKYPAQKRTIETMEAFVDYQKGDTTQAKEKWMNVLTEIASIEKVKSEEMHGIDIVKGGIYAAMGDEKEALKFIRKAKDKNWLDYKVAQKHPAFAGLKDNPEFISIMLEIETKTDSLKTKLKSINP